VIPRNGAKNYHDSKINIWSLWARQKKSSICGNAKENRGDEGRISRGREIILGYCEKEGNEKALKKTMEGGGV